MGATIDPSGRGYREEDYLCEVNMCEFDPPAVGFKDDNDSELSASEALFGFCGWLTTQKVKTIMSASDNAAAICDRIAEFCKANNLADPKGDWHHSVKTPDDIKVVGSNFYNVTINGDNCTLSGNKTTSDQLAVIVYPNRIYATGTVFMCTYHRGPDQNLEGVLSPGRKVLLKEGMKFNFVPENGTPYKLITAASHSVEPSHIPDKFDWNGHTDFRELKDTTDHSANLDKVLSLLQGELSYDKRAEAKKIIGKMLDG